MAFGQINAEQLTTQSGFTLGAGNASSFKNRIINGAMVIDQRNAGASVTISSIAADTYTLDRWCAYGNVASKFSVQQNAGAVTPPTGFKNYIGVTSLASTAVGASDQYYLAQYIEGFNTSDLMFGSASAATITLSFWVRSSLTGTFGGSLTNSAVNRSYPFTYTISAANTWEQKSVTITGDTSGTWLTTNGAGMRVHFGLGVGSSLSGTAGAWAGSAFISATGATSVVGTNGATFYITGVQLEVGTVATSFDYRSYGTELALCQRYFAKTYNTTVVPGTATTAGAITTNVSATWPYAPSGTWCFPVSMRAEPTIVLYSAQNANTTGVSSADAVDGAATTVSLGLSAVSIRRSNNSSGVGSGADMRSQATASAEL